MEELMKNELKVLSEVSHPNIMRIFELLHCNKNYYIVCEQIKGGELEEFMTNNSNMNESVV